jgi:hypothetical protein
MERIFVPARTGAERQSLIVMVKLRWTKGSTNPRTQK